MIGIYFAGQLGNQMFRYACARAIGEVRGDCNYVYGFIDKKRSILDLNVKEGQIIEKDLVLAKGTLVQKIMYLLFKIIYTFIPVKDRNLIKAPSFLVSKGLCLAGNNNDFSITGTAFNERVFFNGTFESPLYFSNIRHILLQEFTPKHPLLGHNTELFDIIRNNNSICISIRRGDFLDKANKGWFEVCNKSYYLKAIELIKEKVDNPVFIFFSNDIEWVKANIKIEGKCYYESGNDPVWESLRLMSGCKHFIISNSTFHWWAQYLSTYDGKIVISPSRWYNAPGPYPLILESFYKIEV